MKRLALLLLCAAGCGARPRRPQGCCARARTCRRRGPDAPGGRGSGRVPGQAEGQSLIEVAAPAGARVDVREGQALIGRDTRP